MNIGAKKIILTICALRNFFVSMQERAHRFTAGGGKADTTRERELFLEIFKIPVG